MKTSYKSSRADKRKWMNEKCEEIEQCFGGNRTRQAFATVGQIRGMFGQRIRSIKSKSGVMLTKMKLRIDGLSTLWIIYRLQYI